MGAWWWLVLAAVVALSVVAALTDGGARLGPRRRRPDGASGTAAEAAARGTTAAGSEPGAVQAASAPLPPPREGELWWTLSPGLALVLVLAVRDGHARVADVTDGESARDPRTALPLPHAAVTGDGRAPVAVLETESVRQVPVAAFRHKAGELDPRTWTRALRLTGGGEEGGEGSSTPL